MSVTISDLKGLQPEVKTKLEFEGIRNTQQFLERTRTPQQRAELAHKVGTTPVAIKELANRADLMRLPGVGGDFSNMLEEAGVNSCKELQHRVPEKLHKTLEVMHTDKKIGHRVPTLAQTTQWIIEAKALAAGKSTDRQLYQNTADLLVDDIARASAADQLLSSAEAEAEKQRLRTEKQAAKDALSVQTPDPRGIHGFYIHPKKST
jgi:hypothetical protein